MKTIEEQITEVVKPIALTLTAKYGFLLTFNNGYTNIVELDSDLIEIIKEYKETQIKKSIDVIANNTKSIGMIYIQEGKFDKVWNQGRLYQEKASIFECLKTNPRLTQDQLRRLEQIDDELEELSLQVYL